MPSGHRPTREPGRVSGPPPAPPTGPVGASSTTDAAAVDKLRKEVISLAARIGLGHAELTTQVRRIADALEPRVFELVGDEAPAPTPTDDDALRSARRDSLLVLLSRAGRGVLTPDEGLLLRHHVEAEISDADTARAVAAGNKRHVQTIVPEIDRLTAEIETADRIRAEAQRDRDQHAAVLREVLATFVHETHPGRRCLQSGHINVGTVERWRSVVAPTVKRPWWEQLAEERARADVATMRAESRARTVARIRGLLDRTPQGQWIDPVALRFIFDTPDPEPDAADEQPAEPSFVETYANPNLIGPADRTG